MSLNLDNFETEEFARDTPFVLTSPTSLQACFELNVEPTELVYKSLEHFEEAFCHLPLSQIYRIYEEAETERQGKLHQCREQRKALLRLREKMRIANYIKKNESSSTTGKNMNNRRGRSAVATTGGGTGSESSGNLSAMRKKKSASATSVGRVYFQRNDLESTKSASTSRENNSKIKNTNCNAKGARRNRWRGSSSSANTNYDDGTSETESYEQLHFAEKCYSCEDSVPISSRSVPDLSISRRGNLNFRKVASSAWSPTRRHYCLCDFNVRDQDIFAEYFKRYDDILSSPSISEEDRRIMERLLLKKAKDLEWERQSQELREIIEADRMKKYRASQILAQQWKDKLAEKRQAENMENLRRYKHIQEKLERQQKDLEKYLEERDQRVRRYLEDLSFKKKQGLVEKQKLEALRQLEVSKAIERLLEEDKQRRESMRDRLQKRISEAEVRKRRREQDYWRHVSEMNRLEDIKRALKLEKIEQQARASVEEIRHQIEEKEHRARLNQLRCLEARDKAIKSGGGRHQQQIEKARKLHEELLRGFDEWNKRALELHVAAQERAGLKHVEVINRRRARAASERILREERTLEMLKRVHEMEERRREMMKSMIQNKEIKSQRHRQEKERSISLSRIRAQQAAELRQQLRERLNPETFDKKAARAEMEMRVLRKPGGGFSVKLNPRLLTKRCSTCKCYHGKMTSYKNGSCSGLNGGGCAMMRMHSKCCNGKDKKKCNNSS